MKFSEKLEKLTSGLNKSKLAKDAGLPATAISNYLSKGQTPRIDTALLLARSLKVPLEWLVDDDQDFPVPSPGKETPANLSDEDLMLEVARRYRLVVLRCEAVLEKFKLFPWAAAAKSLYSFEPGDRIPKELLVAREALWLAYTMFLTSRTAYDAKSWADMRHAQMPGADRDAESLDLQKVVSRFSALARENPEMQLLLDYFDITTDGVTVVAPDGLLAMGHTDSKSKINAARAELKRLESKNKQRKS